LEKGASGPITDALGALRDASPGAMDRLMPLVYDELHRVAHRRLSGEAAHTLQTTELVHEAYARLAQADLRWSDRAHFFALAARTMRRILVDWARARSAEKRGGGAEMVTLRTSALDEAGGADDLVDVLALHAALERLEAQDERKAKVIEVHVFGGLTYVETAEAMGISPATVDREMRMAKAWLARELS
jgi:RNA polymerase sigma factor (TIGR02999 family)